MSKVIGGTGLATARQLAELGATVVAVSRHPERAGEVPASITLAACDVLDAVAVERLLTGSAPFDILVSAATGGPRAFGPFLDMDMAGYLSRGLSATSSTAR